MELYNGSTLMATIDHPPIHLIHGCQFCRAPTLGSCPKCTLVHYCCIQHHIADARYHGPFCSRIKAYIDLYLDPSRPFIFKSSGESFYLLSTLYEADTYATLEVALHIAMGMLQAERFDPMIVRNLVPFILLRLGMFQHCFDFCLAWSREDYMTKSSEVHYDLTRPKPFGIESKQMLTFQRAFFVAPVSRYWPQIVALALLKIRLYLGVKSLPITLPAMTARRNLRQQIATLYLKVNAYNYRFWRLLLDYVPNVQREGDGAPGQTLESVVSISWPAWHEAPDALQFLASLYEVYGDEVPADPAEAFKTVDPMSELW
jgi:hypothetical protein